MDILLATDLAEGGPAGRLILEAVGRRAVLQALDVEYQRPIHAGTSRTADIEVRAPGVRVVIEDKVSDGRFQPAQVAEYAKARAMGSLTALIAPAAFLDRHEADHGLEDCGFIGHVPLETLVEATRRGRETDWHTLDEGRAWRARQLERLARPKEERPAEDAVLQLRSAYQLALTAAGCSFFTVGKVRSGSHLDLEFGPRLANWGAWHDLVKGSVRVKVAIWKGMRHAQRALDAMPADVAPPAGWRGDYRGEYGYLSTDVRDTVGSLEDEVQLERCIVAGAEKLAEVGKWLEDGGVAALDVVNPHRYRWYLEAATELARSHGYAEVAEALSGLGGVLDA